jgi:hypothetical protein
MLIRYPPLPVRRMKSLLDIPELDGLPADERSRLARDAITIRPGNVAWACGVVLVVIAIAVLGWWLLRFIPKAWPWWAGLPAYIAVPLVCSAAGRSMAIRHTRVVLRRNHERSG